MKSKSQPTITNYGNHLEQACYDGLKMNQLTWAKKKIKYFKDLGLAVPYGLIRTEALKK